MSAHRRGGVLRGMVWALGIASVGVIAIIACAKVQRHLQTRQEPQRPMPVQVRLVDWPSWMPDRLAAHIAYRLTPPEADFNDPAITDRVYRVSAANPWVKSVTLVAKRVLDGAPYGVIEVKAQYRRPLVRVAAADGEHYVDADAVRLPIEGVPRFIGKVAPSPQRPDGTVCFIYAADAQSLPISPIHYITVEGVSAPPPDDGQQWQGQDIADGIRLASLAYKRTYFRQIAAVDVRNHAGRLNTHEAPLKLWAQSGDSRRTEVRIDRFAMPEGDYVVPPEQAMLKLDDYYRRHGTIAGINDYIDTRYTQLHVSMN